MRSADYYAGRDACWRGAGRWTCPYPERNPVDEPFPSPRLQWLRGWDDASDDDGGAA